VDFAVAMGGLFVGVVVGYLITDRLYHARYWFLPKRKHTMPEGN
jgi:hypothetical protein